MVRRILIYTSLSFLVIFMAAFSIYGFVRQEYTVGSIGIILLCLILCVFFASIAQYRLNVTCSKLFQEKKFAEERALLEKVRRGPLSFLTRIPAMSHYVCACMALDDLPSAQRIIDRLRHGSGPAWKFHTAYCYILIKLDEQDFKTARREFEEFRTKCAHAEIYKTQIEVLTAIFSHLISAKEQPPLPEAAITSNYPVIGRILGRTYEDESVKE